MGKHAKNNCAAPTFTYAERQKVQWGTVKRRLGSDSLLAFDSCTVCMHQAVDPLVCPKGHLFCKGCIYESLLSQKQFIKRQEKLYEEQEAKQKEDADAAKAKAQKSLVDQFDKMSNSILPVHFDIFGAKQLDNASQVPIGYKAVNTPQGTVYVVDKSVIHTEKAKILPCYWIPTLTPEATAAKIEKPSPLTVCPHGKHLLRLKELRPVLFSVGAEAQSGEDRSDSSEEKKEKRDAKFMCPSCRKILQSTAKVSVVRKCGHVFCRPCTEGLIKKEGTCAQCNQPCGSKDVIELDTGGTGFASSKGTVVSSDLTPSFQG